MDKAVFGLHDFLWFPVSHFAYIFLAIFVVLSVANDAQQTKYF